MISFRMRMGHRGHGDTKSYECTEFADAVRSIGISTRAYLGRKSAETLSQKG